MGWCLADVCVIWCYLEASESLSGSRCGYKKNRGGGTAYRQAGRQADSQLLFRQAAIVHDICRPSTQIHRVIIQPSGTVLPTPTGFSPPPPPPVLISIIQRLTVSPGRKEGRDFFFVPLSKRNFLCLKNTFKWKPVHFNPVITASFPEQGNYSTEGSNSGVLSKHSHDARARRSTPDTQNNSGGVFPCWEFWDELRDGENNPDLFIANKQLSEIDCCSSCSKHWTLLFSVPLPLN